MIRATRRVHGLASAGALEDSGEGGFTLVELLVAISIFAVLSTAVFSGLLSTSKTVNDVQSITNLTEEARVATERMTRELRQASKIAGAHLSTNETDETWITFWVDFDGDGDIDKQGADPEIVTYKFRPGSGELSLTVNDPPEPDLPILAKSVTGFDLEFTSSLWEYDTNGDGVTDWTEIDASALGNWNGIFDSAEFSRIDSVGITIRLLDDTRTQTFKTQVDLRNQNQN